MLTQILMALVLAVWGIGIIYGWIAALCVATTVRKLTPMAALVAISAAAFIASPFVFEGMFWTRYVFSPDGRLLRTIPAVKIMWQKDYNKAVADGIVVRDGTVGTGADQNLLIPVANDSELRVNFSYWNTDENNIRIYSEAIQRGIPIDRETTISALIMLHSTNELARIAEQSKALTNGPTIFVTKTQLASLVFRELELVMKEYGVYPKDAYLSTAR